MTQAKDLPERIHANLDLGMVGTGRWTSAGTENPFDEVPYVRADIHGERMRAVIAEREEARSEILDLKRDLAFYADRKNWLRDGRLDGNSANFTGGPALID
tara:strand:- start:19143 stop:19445 length:303 start_codon:yes stop_codon:yes gene_type:complete